MTGASGHVICLDCGSTVDDGDTSRASESRSVIESLPSSTLPSIPGYRIVEARGIVAAEVVHGMGMGRDLLASMSNTFGGRSGTFERGIAESRQQVIYALKAQAHERGANGLAGAAFDQHLIGGSTGSASMLLVTATATAVVVEPLDSAKNS